ncbi:MAG: carbon starvation protein A [Chitinophagaceae bacterium]|nr:carbon starvation protein A [Chitinophagaceae bacterium]
MKKTVSSIVWIIISLLGAAALATIALERGEKINAVWIVIAAACVYMVAFRFYRKFIEKKVLSVDDRRATPAYTSQDGKDFTPTNKIVLFGHHFAAIAGAGPLVGPVLAAQMGYLPGTLWLIFGAVFAGAVQDMIVLFGSTRRNGRTLGEMIKLEFGNVIGFITKIGIILIMIILIAVLGLVVVKALMGSPWGTFTVGMTIPIAIFMGLYTRYIRPGKISEMSIIGFVLLILALMGGQQVAESPYWSEIFNLKGTTIAILMMVYGFFASVLPVWLLLAPRDYLSTFLKVGIIFMLALCILLVRPELMMPSITHFVDGSGPVFSGKLFPFLFITIACGAISGFHALVSSGTTPKMIQKESHIGTIGYGAMLTESFVAIMAIIAASVIDPGLYFAVNSPASIVGVDLNEVSEAIARMGYAISPEAIAQTAADIGETSIVSRTGGAPTLAIGMVHIFHQILGGKEAMAFWYHFAILFEALFILTTVDAGTRILRFMLQEMFSYVHKPLGETKSFAGNIIATAFAVGAWGYFIYQGVIDPLGGINTLWPLFGLSNQILSVMALTFITTMLYKMKKKKYIAVTLVPLICMVIVTFITSLEKIFSFNPSIGFFAHAYKFSAAQKAGQIIAPAKSVAEMSRITTNDIINGTLCCIFLMIAVIMLIGAIKIWRKILKNQSYRPLQESPYVEMKKFDLK